MTMIRMRGSGAAYPIRAERPEPFGQADGIEEPSVRAEIAVGRSVAGRRDVAGNVVDRLHLAAVARSAARVQKDDAAESGGDTGSIDDPGPGIAQAEPAAGTDWW